LKKAGFADFHKKYANPVIKKPRTARFDTAGSWLKQENLP
jgi:hypothetical protein